MPHDRNGRLVQVGDVVRGLGYNIKHEVMGDVLGVTPATSCNLSIRVHGSGQIEYGQCDAFEVVGARRVGGYAETPDQPTPSEDVQPPPNFSWGDTRTYDPAPDAPVPAFEGLGGASGGAGATSEWTNDAATTSTDSATSSTDAGASSTSSD